MEILGYGGGNFVTMTGSLIISILIPIATYLLTLLVLKLTYRFRENPLMRKLGSQLKKVDVKSAVIPLFISGYLELVICGILSTKMIETKDFNGGNVSDLFSVLFLICCLIILASVPFLTLFQIVNNKQDLDNPEF